MLVLFALRRSTQPAWQNNRTHLNWFLFCYIANYPAMAAYKSVSAVSVPSCKPHNVMVMAIVIFALGHYKDSAADQQLYFEPKKWAHIRAASAVSVGRFPFADVLPPRIRCFRNEIGEQQCYGSFSARCAKSALNTGVNVRGTRIQKATLFDHNSRVSRVAPIKMWSVHLGRTRTHTPSLRLYACGFFSGVLGCVRMLATHRKDRNEYSQKNPLNLTFIRYSNNIPSRGGVLNQVTLDPLDSL